MDWQRVFLGVEKELFSSNLGKIGMGLSLGVFLLAFLAGDRSLSWGQVLFRSSIPLIVTLVIYKVRG